MADTNSSLLIYAQVRYLITNNITRMLKSTLLKSQEQDENIQSQDTSINDDNKSSELCSTVMTHKLDPMTVVDCLVL
jgi:hypothetical protein